VKVNFTLLNGAGTLSAGSAQTDSNGYATVNLSLSQLASVVQVSACVAPSNNPCAQFYANVVSVASEQLEEVAGAGQVSTGQAFQPVSVRVTDTASPPHPVLGATVTFQTTVLRPGGTASGGGSGETNSTNPAMPVILQVSQSSVLTDVNGVASLTPSSGGFSAPLEVDVAATTTSGALLDFPLEVLPGLGGSGVSGTKATPIGRLPVRIVRPVEIGEREVPER